MTEVFAGRYELLDQIGAGGMGAVWRTRDLRTGEVVAAKVLHSGEASALLRFVREQAVRIHHPHVVVPLGWSGEDDRVLFTMPIIDGGSVETLVGDFGALPPRFVAEVMRQMLSALDAVHAARIVHRDVKPANLLLAATGTGRPHAYLSDFGIAVDLDGPRFTETGWVTGTPGYLAPELRTLGEPTPAADLYSLGMVAATMLTGLPPARIPPHGPVPDPPDGGPAGALLWPLVRELCATEPDARPTSAEAAARLAAPELAWTPDAIGDVEVFRHLPGGEPPPPVRGPTLATAPEPAPTALLAPPSPTGMLPRRASRTPAPARPPRPGLVRDIVVLGALAALIVTGLILLLS